MLLSTVLQAHQTGLSYISIKENSAAKIDVVYKMPLSDTTANKVFIRYPSECVKTATQEKSILNGWIIEKYSLWCGSNGLVDKRIWIDGLVAQNRGITMSYKNQKFSQKALLRASTPFMKIEGKSSSLAYFKEYVLLGIHHILSGYDHLLFVLSLVLLAHSRKSLLLAISAFTLSHSITLAAAVLNIVHLPSAFIESMIALSILFLARELMLEEKNTLTKRHLEYVAFIFGLLHGFGFSSVLSALGLPANDLALSLFAFNVGIEIGQLFFIGILLSGYFLLKRYIRGYEAKLQRAVVYFIGTISAFWFIQRVLSF